jgi:hypothetical protein
MDQMEDKLGTILNNPQLMGQIMQMAQSLGQSSPPPEQKSSSPLPDFDPAMMRNLASLAGQGTVDNNQQALLRALNPYLSRRKVEKLEKAMRAARIARMASGFLGQGGLSALMGR